MEVLTKTGREITVVLDELGSAGDMVLYDISDDERTCKISEFWSDAAGERECEVSLFNAKGPRTWETRKDCADLKGAVETFACEPVLDVYSSLAMGSCGCERPVLYWLLQEEATARLELSELRRKQLYQWARGRGNPDGTVFFGIPEIEDVATKFNVSPDEFHHVVEQIADERNIPERIAGNGDVGFEIRPEWLAHERTESPFDI